MSDSTWADARMAVFSDPEIVCDYHQGISNLVQT